MERKGKELGKLIDGMDDVFQPCLALTGIFGSGNRGEHVVCGTGAVEAETIMKSLGERVPARLQSPDEFISGCLEECGMIDRLIGKHQPRLFSAFRLSAFNNGIGSRSDIAFGWRFSVSNGFCG